MREESLQFLTKYLNNPSPTGFESEGQKLWLEYLKPYIDEWECDVYGSVIGIINPQAEYKVVIEAHADEIAWYVSYISDNGYIYVKRNGGSDTAIAPSMRANIYTRNGIVKGVFGWPAIHVRDKAKEEAPTLKNIFLDCGCTSKDEVQKLGVRIGDIVIFEAECTVLQEKWLVGRAVDNRIGGFMIAEVARLLKENNIKLDFGLYIVNAVQEEVGLHGAAMVASRLQPDVAIVTDVTHDTTAPMYDKNSQGERACGKGPVLTVAPAVQNNVLRMLEETAEKKEIPIQWTAASGVTGTDTDAFAYSGKGIASALISLALKYMHTTVEMVHLDDVDNVIKLMYEFIVQLQAGHDFRYLKK